MTRWVGGLVIAVIVMSSARMESAVYFHKEPRSEVMNRRRKKEIAMRIAVGAKRADIAALVMRQAAVMTLVGVVIGGALTVAVARVWQPLLFEVRPDDPLSFTVAAIVIAVASLMGGALPAIQAARLDPIQHLKEV